MTQRIFRSITLASLLVFAVTFGLYLTALYDYFSEVQRSEIRQSLALTAQGVEKSGVDYLNGLILNEKRLTWIAEDGKVLYDSDSSGREMDNHLEREEIRKALASGSGESSRYSDTMLERYFYAAQRLNDGTVLRLSVTYWSAIKLVLGMKLPIMLSLLLAVVLSFLLAGRLTKRIVKPLNEMDLEVPLTGNIYPELNPLLLRLDSQQRELRERQLKLLMALEAQENDAVRRREFTANVSHELKTPLQSISGYSELLKAGMVKSSDVGRFAASIYHEAQRLIALIADLISLSQLDEGAQGLEWEKVNLNSLLTEVKKQFELAAQSMEIDIILRVDDVEIKTIRPLLRIIAANLLDNAIKYNRPGGKVEITLKDTVGDAVLTVADSGIGIPTEHQSRVFERFYRVDKGRSRAAGGTGLGLSIVKHAASVIGAKLDLVSQEGQGTSITVLIPKHYKNTQPS
ncbi:MAG: ATP-binding protein [Selenomonadaceae bacterium]|nr:ATP-binding protein [Selenomonadaceae bacterium]